MYLFCISSAQDDKMWSSVNSGQNSANLAQGSFIFDELNFRRSRLLRIIRKLNSYENNLLYGNSITAKANGLIFSLFNVALA